MATYADTTSLDTDEGRATGAPDWTLVHFDVWCARCGHDLRGLQDPECPACGLEFDWADAVPLEELSCLHCGYHVFGLQDTICPECGEWFSWDEVLQDHYRRKRPLFEYHWRERPIRSFLGTWCRVLRPGKLWRLIDIHDPPQVRPVLVMAAVTLLLAGLLLPPGVGILLWSFDATSRGSTSFSTPGLGTLPDFVIHAFASWDTYSPLGPIIVWCATSLGALMVFQQSMRLCRVRNVHVARVWAYSVPTMPVFMLATAAVVIWSGAWFEYYRWLELGGLAILTCWWIIVIWSIRQAYRYYLRMPDALAVAVASQIIAVLAMFVFVIAYLEAVR